MNRIRLATPEEIEKIKPQADLDQNCTVLALDTQAGTPIAVLRTCVELDPALFPEGFTKPQIAMFTHDVETFLVAKGALSYYFNADPDDEKWIHVIKGWGCEQVSPKPYLRFKQSLL